MKLKAILVVGGLMLALSDAALAVIVAGPQGRNLSAPTGDLAGSGWDFQGEFSFGLGTPISRDWFITATHIGTSPSIVVNGVAHGITGNFRQIPGTDLVLRQVATPFDTWSPVFAPTADGELTASDTLVVFGRGRERGAAIPGKGYQWGDADLAKSWGTNTFEGLDVITPAVAAATGLAAGSSYLIADFDNDAGPNEAALAEYDSGGGVFVERDGEWKLVAINYGVETFRTSAGGANLNAAIYDARGLYGQVTGNSYTYIDPAAYPSPYAQAWFSSYVPDALGLIQATPATGVPEPAGAGVAVAGVVMTLGRRRRDHRRR